MFFSCRTLARTASVFFTLLIAVFILPVAAAPSAAAAEADSIYGLVNQARWDNGQQGLLRNADMDAVALSWAKEMAANDTMSHNPDYASQIPSGWRSAGENVAQGYRTAQAMHDGWMSSPGHKENILGAYTDIGIAFYANGGITWGVQVFATYPGHTGPDAPAPADVSPPTSETDSAANDDSNTSGSSTSGGAIGTINSDAPPALSDAELQASVYDDKRDDTWVAWVVFFSVLAFGSATWFVIWRRTQSAPPTGHWLRRNTIESINSPTESLLSVPEE